MTAVPFVFGPGVGMVDHGQIDANFASVLAGLFDSLTVAGTLGVTGAATVGGTIFANGNAITAAGALGITAGGANLINLRNTNGILLQAAQNGAAAIANFLAIGSNIAGQPVSVSALGTDININLNLNTKGSGIVNANGALQAQHLTASNASTVWASTPGGPGVSNLYSGGGISGIATGNAAVNWLASLADNVDASGANGNYLSMLQLDDVIGALAKGGRNSLTTNLSFSASPAGVGGAFVGGTFNVSTAFPLGGTGLSATLSKGQLYGFNPSVGLFSGATNINGLIGGEIDLAARTGSSYWVLNGLSVILNSPHAVHGAANQDTGFLVGSQPGISTGFDYAYRVGGTDGPWPLVSTGTIFGLLTGTTALTVAFGIDLLPASISGSAFRSTGFNVDGPTGGITAPSLKSGANQVVGARVTGWGAGSNGSRAALNGSTATLAQTSAALAQLIADITAHGLIGA